MRAEIARLQNRLGATTVYVTHDQTEAMTLGDRVVVLLAGAVQQIGTPRGVVQQPGQLFVAGFIGSPAIELLPGHDDRRGGAAAVWRHHTDPRGARLLAQHPTANNVIVGVRPEHLEDAALIDTYARIRA